MRTVVLPIIVGLVVGWGVAVGINAAWPADKPAPHVAPHPVPACVVAQAATARAWQEIAVGEQHIASLLALGHHHRAVAVQREVNRYRRHHLTTEDCP